MSLHSFNLYPFKRFKNLRILIFISLFFSISTISGYSQDNCLNFDGTNDYVDLGTISPVGNFSTGFTFMAKVKLAALNNNAALFDIGNGTALQNIVLSINGTSNGLIFSAYKDNSVPAKGTMTADNCLSPDVWTDIAVSISSNGYSTIYINGIWFNGGFTRPPGDVARTKCYLGKSNTIGDGYLNGSIDEVSIWSRTLSDTEVKNYTGYNLAGNENGLYVYYKFNQGVSGGSNTGITNLLDATLTGRNGTLLNFDLSSNSSNWIKNESGNLFTKVANPNISPSVSRYVPGDYNKDGYMDILGITSDKTIVYKNNGDLSFTEEPSIILPGGNSYTSLDWVDYDNDNDLDIFITGLTSSGKIAEFYRNDGSDVFTKLNNTSILGIENGLSSWGDYDNDGDLDLLLAGVFSGYYPETKIYRNNGDDTFILQSDIFLPGFRGSSGGWGDYDNDGDMDILLAGNNGNVDLTRIFRNDGKNKFVNTNISLTPCSSGSASWGDYDSDGDLDILFVGSNAGANLSKVYRNMGQDVFEEQTGISLMQLVGPFAQWGDFDNDGLTDILLLGFDYTNTSARFYHNNGDFSYTELSNKINDLNSEAFCAADFNNDGKLDIASKVYINGNYQSIMFVNTMGASNTTPNAPAGLETIFTDTTVVFKWNRAIDDNSPSKGLSYNLRIGTSSGASDIVSPAANASGMRYLTGTGNMMSDTFFVYKNPIPATFYWSVQSVDNSYLGGLFAPEKVSNYSIEVQASELSVSVLEGINLSLKWKRGNGLATAVFGKKSNSGIALPVDGIGYSANSVFGLGSKIGSDDWFCVYNGTADNVEVSGLDFATDYIFQAIDYSPGQIYFSEVLPTSQVVTKTKNFSEAANLDGIYRSAQAWGDFDNDKDLDLITTGIIKELPVTKLYRNDGNFQLTEVENHGITAISDGAVAWGDYDNDGVIDLLISGLSSSTEITKIFHNNENGTFSELTSSSFLGLMECNVEWVDFDNDGDLDFIISGKNASGSYTKIYKNNKNGSFTEPTVALPGAVSGAMASGDYNNDGNIDILLTGGNNTSLYRNDGDFKFSLQSGTGLPAFNDVTAIWVDEDNDGLIDIFLSGNQKGWSNIAGIFHNNGNNTFTKTNQVFDNRNTSTVECADLNGDGFVDVVIAGGLTLNSYVPKVYFNNGDGSYTEQTEISLPDVYQCDLSAADIDNNGTMELIITGAENLEYPIYNYYARLYSFDSPTAKTIPSEPTGLTSVVVENKNVKLSWNRVYNNVQKSKGLNYNVSIGSVLSGDQVKPYMSFVDGTRKIAMPGNCSDTSFTIKNLTPGKYYWSVQAIDNGYSGGIPAIDSFEFEAIQAINLKAELFTTEGSLKLSWDNGNGSQRIVFCKKGTTGNATPVNNTSYYADAEYGVGSQIGISGWYCVFNGRADSTFVNGLLPGDEYLFEVMEYTGGAENQVYNQNFSGSNLGSFSAGVFSRKTNFNIDPTFGYNFVDLNADGYLDLVSSGDVVYLNNGDQSFQTTQLSEMGIPGPYETADFKLKPAKILTCADFNNDGYFDLMTRRDYEKLLPYNGSSYEFMWTRFNSSQVWVNNKNGSFTQSDSLYCDEGYSSGTVATDIENDGDVDLLLIYKNFTQIFQNIGNGKFEYHESLITTESDSDNFGRVLEGDINNDGYIDLVVNAFSYMWNDTSKLKFFVNDGRGSFLFKNEIIASSLSIALGDYDKDGDLDIIGSQTFSEMNPEPAYLFRNDGSCNFSDQSQDYIKGGYSGYATWMDYDNDGYPDILSTGILSDYAFSTLYRNNQNNSFSEFTEVNIAGVSDGSGGFGDVDNDGDLDFLLTGRINTHGNERTGAFYQNNIYMNAGPFPANRKPDVPLNPTTAIQAKGIQLKWDAVTSDETPEMAMTYNLRFRNVDSTVWLGAAMASETGERRIAGIGNLQQNKTVILSLKEGSYIWQVQAIDGGYSASPWSVLDTFQTKATQAFFTADTACLGTPTQFTDKSLSSDEISGWQWDFGDGSSISTIKDPSHLYSNSGIHTAKLIVTNSKGVSDTIFSSVKVKESPVVFFIADDVCEGTTASIDNQTTNEGVVITSWSWDFGDGKTSALEEPVNHVYATQNSYLMKLTATGNNACIGSMSKTVTIATRPNATISLEYGVPSFCKGDSVIYSASANSNYKYHWLRDNEYIAETSNVLKVKTLSGVYKLEVKNKASEACVSTSLAKTISIKDAPSVPTIAEATNTTLFCAGTTVELNVTNPSSDFTYQWKRSGVSIDKAVQTTYKGQLTAGEYSVEAKTGNCGTSSGILTLNYTPAAVKPKILARGPNIWILGCDNLTSKDYKWYYNDELIVGAKTHQYVANQELGNYRVEVTDGGECYTSSDVINIPTGNIISGIEDLNADNIELFPNPTENILNVNFGKYLDGKLEVEILNEVGSVLSHKEYSNTAGFTLDISGFAKGVYYCRFTFKQNSVIRKVVKL